MESNKELLPSTDEERDLSGKDLFFLCSGMVVNVVGLVIPSQVFLRGGVTPAFVLLATLIGYLVVTVLISLIGDIGMKYGIPFVIFIKDCFGKKGAIIGSILRAIICLTWIGVLIYFGSEAINEIFKALTGLSAYWTIFTVFSILQFYNASKNIKSMSRFSWIAIPLLAMSLLCMVIWLLAKNNLTFYEVYKSAPLETTQKSHGLFTIASIFAGGWLTTAINGGDLSRKLKRTGNPEDSFCKRNKNMLLAFSVGFTGTGLIITTAGVIASILTKTANPVQMITTSFASNPLYLTIGCLIVVLAQWSTNTVANIFPPTLILLNMFPKLSFAKATWIVGILGILIVLLPFNLLGNLDFVQIIFSQLLGPMLAIMVCHYYVIKKCNIDVQRLYDKNMEDWNIHGFVAYIVGFLCGALIKEFAFFIGFFTAFLTYYITNTINNKKIQGR